MSISKKSQVTLFIIAGILALVVAGFLIYILGESKTRKVSVEPDSSPVTGYVTECLKRFTEQGIEYASMQSGYIYKSQGGSVIDMKQEDEGKAYINYSNRVVPYLIKRLPTAEIDPNYPWATFPNAPAGTGTTYKYTLGISTMQTKRQLEQQLEAFVEKKMRTECQLQSDVKAYGVKFFSRPKATATITNTDVFVQLRFPMEVTERSTDTHFKLREFSVSKPSSLGKLYDAAKKIVDKENQDFSFKLNEIPMANGVSIITVHNAAGNDDVIILKNESSGATFTFARQNRRPALHYISGPTTCNSIRDNGVSDPDEDSLQVTCNPTAGVQTITVSDGHLSDSQTGVTITS